MLGPRSPWMTPIRAPPPPFAAAITHRVLWETRTGNIGPMGTGPGETGPGETGTNGAGSPRTRHARDRMKRGITGRFLYIRYFSSYYEDNNKP